MLSMKGSCGCISERVATDIIIQIVESDFPAAELPQMMPGRLSRIQADMGNRDEGAYIVLRRDDSSLIRGK